MTVMVPPTTHAPEPTDEEIALGAYRIWLQEGCPSGRDQEHWLKAREKLIAERLKEEEAKAGEDKPTGN
jgi:predicted CoA-binding protein